MFVVRFSNMRALEYPNPRAFDQRVGKWLVLREGENSYLLGELPKILAKAAAGHPINERLFTVEDGDQLVSVGILLDGGCLCMSWATDEIVDVLVEHLAKVRCHVTSVFAPGHVSWHFAQKWALLTGQAFEFGRSERVYQVARVTYNLPESGRLAVASHADFPILSGWVKRFMDEAGFEGNHGHSDELLQAFIRERSLFVWHNPEPVSMAAWVAPTPNGGAINFVYTPPAFRRCGHGKAVVAALAQHQLSRGKKYCFILTDTLDEQTNHMYQAVGGRTLCELLRCSIQAAPARNAMNAANAQQPRVSVVG